MERVKEAWGFPFLLKFFQQRKGDQDKGRGIGRNREGREWEIEKREILIAVN